jgi:hypothetical protein
MPSLKEVTPVLITVRLQNGTTVEIDVDDLTLILSPSGSVALLYKSEDGDLIIPISKLFKSIRSRYA